MKANKLAVVFMLSLTATTSFADNVYKCKSRTTGAIYFRQVPCLVNDFTISVTPIVEPVTDPNAGVVTVTPVAPVTPVTPVVVTPIVPPVVTPVPVTPVTPVVTPIVPPVTVVTPVVIPLPINNGDSSPVGTVTLPPPIVAFRGIRVAWREIIN